MKILSGIYYIYYRTPGNNRCQWKGTFFLDLAAALAAWSVLASPKILSVQIRRIWAIIVRREHGK